MDMTLQRGQPGFYSIPGELFIQQQHAAFTLENLADAIPSGSYKIALYPSPSWRRIMPLLENVPGRTYIEIHPANLASELKGCIAVGQIQDLAEEEILFSDTAFLALFPAIEAAVEAEGCWITILEPLTNAEEVQDAACGES
jgi:hypothetical protein